MTEVMVMTNPSPLRINRAPRFICTNCAYIIYRKGRLMLYYRCSFSPTAHLSLGKHSNLHSHFNRSSLETFPLKAKCPITYEKWVMKGSILIPKTTQHVARHRRFQQVTTNYRFCQSWLIASVHFGRIAISRK